ncbi:hypothetical protein AB1Y20_018833 [Prymnesium parvum]|uniref:5-formyltetrahydrofolate cyclo-ligase n=1 Tax=Prymnesium parvum TaxID=97485 RepID=A0AB34JTL3_PRYPA
MAVADKGAMRSAMRRTLRALSEEEVHAASRRACDRVLQLDAVRRSAAVSVYLSMPSGECQTSALILQLFEAGKSIFVPRVEGRERGDMRMLRVHSAAHLDSFPRSNWGIPEPSAAEADKLEDGLAQASIDTVIVPAVAFDSSCHRLGHGKGYYDTFLEKLCHARKARGLPPPVLIGLGLNEQLVERVPVGEHDFPLDAVCLPDTVLIAQPGKVNPLTP